jgi:hypothetical protein
MEVITITDRAMYNRLKGNILLKVEDLGKAYYVHPDLMKMYYLGRPTDAFRVMRQQSVGMTNANLIKIPIGLGTLSGTDKDSDGLADLLEEALGSSLTKADTDSDGFSDKTELETGYNLFGAGKAAVDRTFAGRQAGRILLQVQGHGEAWYVSPTDNKRYYLGRPADAFAIMKKLGIGISNHDFENLIK